MIKKIDHIGIVVRDLEESLKVYTGAFGMRLVKREQLTTMDVLERTQMQTESDKAGGTPDGII